MPAKSQNIFVKASVYALFGLLIVAFGIWGIGDIFRGSGRARAVAEVGDARILEQEFQRTLSREVNRLSSRLGTRLDLEQARGLGVVDQVLTNLITQTLLEIEARRLGLVVTESQIIDVIQKEPAFRNAQGAFDRNRLSQALLASGMSEGEFLASVRHDTMSGQMVGAVSTAATAPRKLAEALYRYRQEHRVAQYLLVPNDSITDLPEPDQQTLEAFHKEFSERFQAPEYRSVSLVEIRAEDLAAELAIPESQIEAEYAARKESLTTPERRTISQIVLPDEFAARSAYDQLREGREFAAVAREATGEAPIDLGKSSLDDLLPELAEPAFALEAGGVSEPIKTTLGWHILRVGEIQPRQEPSLAEVRDQLRHNLALHEAVDDMVTLANHLDDELAGGASLTEAAVRLGLTSRKIPAVSRQGSDPAGESLSDLPGSRFLEVAFETAVGEDSLLTETNDSGYFVLHVDSVTPAKTKPLEEVRAEVVKLWREARQGELALKKAQELAERVRQGTKLAKLAEETGLTLQTTVPLTRFDSAPERTPSPLLPGRLFELKVGAVTTASTGSGHMVAELTEVQPADPAADKAGVDAVVEQLSGAVQNDMVDQFVKALRREIDVSVDEGAVNAVLGRY